MKPSQVIPLILGFGFAAFFLFTFVNTPTPTAPEEKTYSQKSYLL
jgi:hypothetical protein